MIEFTNRTDMLIPDCGKRLAGCNLLIVGVGGVGGYVAEFLIRCGVGEITLVDFDKIDITNINRQIVATSENIGRLKVDEMKIRLKAINPTCIVNVFAEKYTSENQEKFFQNKHYDYVIDCIDDVDAKLALICYCKNNGINIVSALGAGNRIGLPNFKYCDIFETKNDGLAKKMRKLLRDAGISELDVVYSDEKCIKTEQSGVGSIVYYPAMCACVLTSYVINKLVEDKQ